MRKIQSTTNQDKTSWKGCKISAMSVAGLVNIFIIFFKFLNLKVRPSVAVAIVSGDLFYIQLSKGN